MIFLMSRAVFRFRNYKHTLTQIQIYECHTDHTGASTNLSNHLLRGNCSFWRGKQESSMLPSSRRERYRHGCAWQLRLLRPSFVMSRARYPIVHCVLLSIRTSSADTYTRTRNTINELPYVPSGDHIHTLFAALPCLTTTRLVAVACVVND